MYKQVIIARKDLNMSYGKFAAQVSHASMAFLTNMIRDNAKKVEPYKYKTGIYRRFDLARWSNEARARGEKYFHARPVNPKDPCGELELCDPYCFYRAKLDIDKDTYEEWINGAFTKVVLGAKNRNQLLKAKTMAEELGMKEGKDFFLIRDNCRTELEPEEDGRTLTTIGFRPMDSETIDKIGRKYQLYS